MNRKSNQAAKLYIDHLELVKGTALRFAPRSELVEDIVQDVFVEFVSNAEKWDLDRDVHALLFAITKNKAQIRWRETTRAMPEKLRLLSEHVRRLAESDFEEPYHRTKIEALQRCLERLPEKSRQVVELFYFKELSARQLSEILQVKQNTVHRALARLRDGLRTCIEQLLAKS